MNIHDATERAYQNGYARGFSDAQGANMKICDKCVCRPVCNIFNATGGVGRCEHYHEEESINGKRFGLS